MSVTVWRSLLTNALEKNPQPVSQYLQLATIQPNNRPANRTLVFRGFVADSDKLKFVVDARSQKPEQIQHQPWAEACWYFIETREQFRISGSLTLVTEDHQDQTLQQARLSTWQQLSDSARLLFAFPDPGKLRTDATFTSSPPDPINPLPHFCLLLLEPIEVDLLQLRGNPQNRYTYFRNGDNWEITEINP